MWEFAGYAPTAYDPEVPRQPQDEAPLKAKGFAQKLVTILNLNSLMPNPLSLVHPVP